MYASRSLQLEINNLFEKHLAQYSDEWTQHPEDHLRLKDAHRHLDKLFTRYANIHHPVMMESVELGLLLIEEELDFDAIESKIRSIEDPVRKVA